MAKPFRFQTVARLREARRDAARAHLADALRAAEVLAERRAELQARFAELTAQRRDAAQRADTAWLLSAGRYELALRAEDRKLTEQVTQIEAEVERRRQALTEADRDVRAMETLRERAALAAREEANRRESLLLDGFAGRAAYAVRTESTVNH